MFLQGSNFLEEKGSNFLRKKGQVALGNKFLNVWQKNIRVKFCLNQMFLYHWKIFQSVNILNDFAFLNWSYELKVMTKKKLTIIFFKSPFPLVLQKLSNDIINIWFEQSLSLTFSCETFGNLFFNKNCSLRQFNPLLLWGKANLILSNSSPPWGKGNSIFPRGRKQFRPLRQPPFHFSDLVPFSTRKKQLPFSLKENAT